ncbi:hypothetical protein AAVH_24412 [Aphelenchoides avenae]|nr:hypothetical protein AAVH_24412 [Aphelenchus avenae]
MFPVVGSCTLGLMRYLGDFWGVVVAWGVHNLLIGVCYMSLLSSALYRLASVTNKLALLTSKPAIALMVVCHPLLTSPAIAVHFALATDTNELREYAVAHNPEVASFYVSHSCVMYSIGNTNLFIYTSVATTIIFLWIGLYVGILSVAFKKLFGMRRSLSARTYQLHLALTKSLVYQFLLPLALINLPYMVFAIMAMWQPPFAQGRYRHPVADL